MTCMRIAQLYKEAGLPEGVINIITCSRNEADLLMEHPDIAGISFVGSTAVGLHIYEKAAQNGKRVQTLCEAKNHALVLEDVAVERTVRGIINSAFGCAGERCMALPVVVVQEGIADRLADTLVKFCNEKIVGPAYDPPYRYRTCRFRGSQKIRARLDRERDTGRGKADPRRQKSQGGGSV